MTRVKTLQTVIRDNQKEQARLAKKAKVKGKTLQEVFDKETSKKLVDRINRQHDLFVAQEKLIKEKNEKIKQLQELATAHIENGASLNRTIAAMRTRIEDLEMACQHKQEGYESEHRSLESIRTQFNDTMSKYEAEKIQLNKLIDRLRADAKSQSEDFAKNLQRVVDVNDQLRSRAVQDATVIEKLRADLEHLTKKYAEELQKEERADNMQTVLDDQGRVVEEQRITIKQYELLLKEKNEQIYQMEQAIRAYEHDRPQSHKRTRVSESIIDQMELLTRLMSKYFEQAERWNRA